MTTTAWIIVLVVVIIAVAAVAWMYMQKRRTEQLREHYGPEYERTVREYKDPNRAKSALEEREKRVEALNIRPLALEERGRFAESWKSVQTRFVDDPSSATREADQLVAQVMQARGYPVRDFE